MTDLPTSGRPPGIARRIGRPRKGEPTLTRERIGRAVLDEAAGRGADRVTMRSIAERLSVTPRALYKIVRDRDDALAAAVAVAEREWPDGPHDPERWEDGLARFVRELRAWYRRYPVLLRIVASTPMDDEVRAAALRNMEVLAGFLLATGLPPEDVVRGCDLIIGTVAGFTEIEEWEARAAAADPRNGPPEEVTPVTRAAANEDELPHLRSLGHVPPATADERFEGHVEMLLLWLGARIP
ncbi:TetR/AcrR family transcriptional regulator C-terminal domain-containing protein [Pseudonocardia sp. NPDC049635]|uniref:TetR/AcrR family transcriptional regulator C-terminal domain-containing protein n=1 Tax=Pseudonocardia sp. NPDC049635 TaxID=3155506 RepID=UPI0033DCA36B